ncbi:hypothetical protein HDN1F_20360 [gamma proteobacterium HdN1]|nr:hypothetical protein HDN1F_20360 [gamma proteobacterium HdN1]
MSARDAHDQLAKLTVLRKRRIDANLKNVKDCQAALRDAQVKLEESHRLQRDISDARMRLRVEAVMVPARGEYGQRWQLDQIENLKIQLTLEQERAVGIENEIAAAEQMLLNAQEALRVAQKRLRALEMQVAHYRLELRQEERRKEYRELEELVVRP